MVKILEINDGWKYGKNKSFDILNLDCISGIKFRSYKSLKDIFPHNTTLSINNSSKPSDIFYHALKLFVSYKVAQIILKSNTDSIELFPVNVIWNGDKYTETSFFLMNIMSKIDCIDKDLSEYEVDKYIDEDDNTAYISEISKLVIYPIDENIHKIFFIGDTFGTSLELSVCDEIAQEIISQSCTGCKLIDVGLYRRL